MLSPGRERVIAGRLQEPDLVIYGLVGQMNALSKALSITSNPLAGARTGFSNLRITNPKKMELRQHCVEGKAGGVPTGFRKTRIYPVRSWFSFLAP